MATCSPARETFASEPSFRIPHRSGASARTGSPGYEWLLETRGIYKFFPMPAEKRIRFDTAGEAEPSAAPHKLPLFVRADFFHEPNADRDVLSPTEIVPDRSKRQAFEFFQQGQAAAEITG
jgi:hypothetical protein